MAPQLKEEQKVLKGSYGLTPDNINSNMLNIRYAVRGPLVNRAEVLEMDILQVCFHLQLITRYIYFNT